MKIAIIGAGNIGSQVANGLIYEYEKLNISQICLIDIAQNIAIAKALDLSHSVAVLEKDIQISGSNDYSLLDGANIVVITAGMTRKEWQSRDDLTNKNAKIVFECASQIAKFAPNSIIISVTNPLDLMLYVVKLGSKFDNNKIIGMAGELDSARLKFEISQINKEKISSINSPIVGTHDDNMVILESEIFPKISDLNLLKTAIHNTKNAGKNIVNLLNTSAYFAPAAGILKIIKSIVLNENKTLICSILDENNVPIGRFVKIDKNGVGKILDFPYPDEFYDNYNEIKNKILNFKL